ncbi:MAG: hypothetical protein DRQ98_05565 [Gammaproteobacteria bacterium]|nr:MAG: hypothetical protein DRQ98_05565 [Gammaproteobacteria bacterium]
MRSLYTFEPIVTLGIFGTVISNTTESIQSNAMLLIRSPFCILQGYIQKACNIPGLTLHLAKGCNHEFEVTFYIHFPGSDS